MTTLPNDVARCAGRMDLLPDGQTCPERDTCQRYLALIEWDRGAGIPDYQGIPVMMGMRNCEIKIEVDYDDAS